MVHSNKWKIFIAGEFKRISKNGDEIWINASYNPILDDTGKPFNVVKFATDITEEKLRTAEQDGKMAAINRSKAVIEFEPDGTIIIANENFTSTVEYSLDDITGRHHRMFCDQAYVNSKVYSHFWDELRAGNFQSVKFQRFGNSGEEIWLRAYYSPILDAENKVVKVGKFASDITTEVELEK
ncbi:MAG: PAS domain-containing protein [Mangrovicoccus sp.]